MKKHIALLVVGLMLTTFSFAQNYKRDGKQFEQVQPERKKSESKDVRTVYTWKDSKGNIHPIWLTPKGAAYIIRTSSKTGKEYKYYLPKELAKEITKEMGR